MRLLITEGDQREIASGIDRAVRNVLAKQTNHGNEEGVTAVLGHALMAESFHTSTLSVQFNYRQLNKITEEPHAGADGGLLVRVRNKDGTTQKAALFQAKLLEGGGPVRALKMSQGYGRKLAEQARHMLSYTSEAVALFYTSTNIYVVDAGHYASGALADTRRPLAEPHRLITLATYLGRWLPRCTRGDLAQDLISRVTHCDGFKHGLTMDVITARPSIAWEEDRAAIQWQHTR